MTQIPDSEPFSAEGGLTGVLRYGFGSPAMAGAAPAEAGYRGASLTARARGRPGRT